MGWGSRRAEVTSATVLLSTISDSDGVEVKALVELGVGLGVGLGVELGVELGDARRADILGRPIEISLATLIYRLRHFNFFS